MLPLSERPCCRKQGVPETSTRRRGINDAREREKVTIMRARLILEKNCDFTKRITQQFPTHFDLKMNEQNKRIFIPWLLEKCIERHIGSKPKSIRTSNKTIFVVEVNSKEQSTVVQEITNINGISAEISVNNFAHLNRGLIYIYGYNMNNFESFKASLMEQHDVQDVTEATWIKTRSNNRLVPLLLTFHKEVPQFIDIPGEMMKTRVVEYKQRPLMCKKCLIYEHGKNNCEEEQRCGKCSDTGHNRTKCTEQKVRCFHCEGDHEAGNRMCSEQRYQEEIVAVQRKERVSWAQAKVIVNKKYPQVKMNYAAMVKVNGAESNGTGTFQRKEAIKSQRPRVEVSARRGGGGMHESR